MNKNGPPSSGPFLFGIYDRKDRLPRHGAPMSEPNYARWHGIIYYVAKHFYTDFMPEVKEACEKAGQKNLYQ